MTASASTPAGSRTQGALLAFGASSGFLVTTMLLSFAATPVLVRAMGVERFGVYRSMLEVFGFLALLEFGMAGASRPIVVSAVATRDPTVVAHTLRAIARAFLGPLLLKLLAASLLALVFPVIFKVPPDLRSEARAAGAVFVLLVATTPTPVFNHLLAAQQRDYRNVLVQGLQNVGIVVLSVAAAILGYGLVGQAAVLAGAGIAGSIALFSIVRPYFKVDEPRPDLEQAALAQLRQLNWPTFQRSLCGRVGLHSDRLFIAGMLTTSLVTQFHVSVRLVDIAVPFLFAIGNASWPAIAEIKLRGEHGLLEERLTEVSTLIAMLGVLLLSPIVVVSAPFVERWMGPNMFLGHAVVCLAAFNAIVLALIAFWDNCLGAVGEQRKLVRPAVVGAVVNVAVSVVATRLGGAIGPLVGTCVAMGGVTAAWTMQLLSTQLRVRSGPLFWAWFRVLALGAAFAGIGLFTLSPRCQPTWPSIAAHATAVASAWAGLCWWLVMNDGMRRRTLGRITHLLSRLRKR